MKFLTILQAGALFVLAVAGAYAASPGHHAQTPPPEISDV